jgi:hypothetical protein
MRQTCALQGIGARAKRSTVYSIRVLRASTTTKRVRTLRVPARNVELDTTARVVPLVMAQSFAPPGISVHQGLAPPPGARLASFKTRKEPSRKMTAYSVLPDITAQVAQHRRGRVRQGRFRQT